MAKKLIGILTGGGDVPGLNSVIKSVVYRGAEYDHRGDRDPPGLGGAHPPQPRRSGEPVALRLAAQPREHADHRPDRRHLPALARGPTRPRWAKLPKHLEGKDFPVAQATKAGVVSTTYDVSKQVLKNLEALGLELPAGHRRRRHALLRRQAPPVRVQGHRHPEDDGQRRPQHRVLHRLLDGDHPRHATPSSGSGPRSARTSGSASSASSAATPASRRSTPPTSPRSAVSSPNTRSISTS